MKNFLIRFYLYFIKNWNIIVTLIAMIGVTILHFLPNASEKYINYFIFIGLNAVVWTLIEIKIKFDGKEQDNNRIENMRLARPEIIKAMCSEMKKNGNEILEINIVGGRIRTISDMIREIKNEITSKRLKVKNIKFKILTLSPEFVVSSKYSKKQNEQTIKRNRRYATLISNFSDELINFNEINEFKENNITICIDHYNCIPYFYCFIIGGKKIFWGHFTWDKEKDDFMGPENPCYFLVTKNSEFHEYYYLLGNRIEHLRST